MFKARIIIESNNWTQRFIVYHEWYHLNFTIRFNEIFCPLQIDDDSFDRDLIDIVEPREAFQRARHVDLVLRDFGGHVDPGHHTGHSRGTVLGRRRDIVRVFLRHGGLLHLVPRGLRVEDAEGRGPRPPVSAYEVERCQLRSYLAHHRERVRIVRKGVHVDDHQLRGHSLHSFDGATPAGTKIQPHRRRYGTRKLYNSDNFKPFRN